MRLRRSQLKIFNGKYILDHARTPNGWKIIGIGVPDVGMWFLSGFGEPKKRKCKNWNPEGLRIILEKDISDED